MPSKRADPNTPLAQRKEQQAKDGAKAMAQYEAEILATRAKTEKLRALRLAREAEESAAAQTQASIDKIAAADRASKEAAKEAAKEASKAAAGKSSAKPAGKSKAGGELAKNLNKNLAKDRPRRAAAKSASSRKR